MKMEYPLDWCRTPTRSTPFDLILGKPPDAGMKAHEGNSFFERSQARSFFLPEARQLLFPSFPDLADSVPHDERGAVSEIVGTGDLVDEF